MRLSWKALVMVLAVLLAFAGPATVLAQATPRGPGAQGTEAAIQGIVVGVDNTSTPSTVTVHPKQGADVILKIVSGTRITRAGKGTASLADVKADDRAKGLYDRGTLEARRLDITPPLNKCRSYLGTVKSVGTNSFVLTPKGKPDVTVAVNAATRYKVPGVRAPTLSNIIANDTVAVLALDENGVNIALNVMLVPKKPIAIHIGGTVSAYEAGKSITVKDMQGKTFTFPVTPRTRVKLQRGATTVKVGDRAAVLARRDPDKEQYAATDIVVFGPPEKGPKGGPQGPGGGQGQGGGRKP